MGLKGGCVAESDIGKVIAEIHVGVNDGRIGGCWGESNPRTTKYSVRMSQMMMTDGVVIAGSCYVVSEWGSVSWNVKYGVGGL